MLKDNSFLLCNRPSPSHDECNEGFVSYIQYNYVFELLPCQLLGQHASFLFRFLFLEHLKATSFVLAFESIPPLFKIVFKGAPRRRNRLHRSLKMISGDHPGLVPTSGVPLVLQTKYKFVSWKRLFRPKNNNTELTANVEQIEILQKTYSAVVTP